VDGAPIIMKSGVGLEKEPLMVAQLCVFITIVLSSASICAWGQARGEITEITYESCSSWIGPMGKFVLKKDLRATLTALNFKSETPESITYRGHFNDFESLATAFKDNKFFGLAKNYSSEAFDLNIVIISAVRNGKRTVVVDYGQAGPDSLLKLEHLLYDVTRKNLKWGKSGVVSPGYSKCTGRELGR
jgi:hypothetical protein